MYKTWNHYWTETNGFRHLSLIVARHSKNVRFSLLNSLQIFNWETISLLKSFHFSSLAIMQFAHIQWPSNLLNRSSFVPLRAQKQFNSRSTAFQTCQNIVMNRFSKPTTMHTWHFFARRRRRRNKKRVLHWPTLRNKLKHNIYYI